MPPPKPPGPPNPAPGLAKLEGTEPFPVLLPVIVTSVRVRAPEFMMPPPWSPAFPKLPLPGTTPSALLPLVTVMPEMLTVTVELKIRKLGVPPARLRRTVREIAPGPVIIMFELRLGSAAVRSIIPVTEMLIVSAPLLLPAAHSPIVAPDAALLFAAVIASRKVHNPSLLLATSDKLFTVI